MRGGSFAMVRKMERALKDLAGSEVYNTWVKMLRTLVPAGRTLVEAQESGDYEEAIPGFVV